MPLISRKPSPQQSLRLSEALKKCLTERNISLRQAASQIGIDASHLSRLLNLETTPDAGVCNLIADFLNLPRVDIYAKAGWLEMDGIRDVETLGRLQSLELEPEDLTPAEFIFMNIGDSLARVQYVDLLRRLTNK